jgi:hypothetical protein
MTGRRLSLWLVLAALLVGLAVAVTGLVRGHDRLAAPFDAALAGYTGSQACVDCHDDRHESWYSTYHRTMTQEATPETVQGRFDGQPLDYWGMRVLPVKEDGRFFFEYRDLETGASQGRMELHRTVGSHRYQQYLGRLPDGGTFVRLHYLWHNEDERWVHMNAAFLGPDAMPFDRHAAIWNQNCIFCHNTAPEPNIQNYEALKARAARGEPVNATRETRFDSSVAELGIACESCHGPGETHASRAEDAFTRTAMRLWPGRDNSIVNPVRLDAPRDSQVCGQCHAQRTPTEPEKIAEWMKDGPSYRPGDDLHEHVTPIWRDSQPPAGTDPDLFRLRFWDDGTPRLTAYEYQGLLQSDCHQAAELSCMDCHTMHAGDPAGQLTERNRTNAPCLRCHQDFGSEEELTAHTRHPADSDGSQCYSCHMPHITYGVMDIHRSHRIEVPDAHRDAAGGRPNACLNCHQGESFEWAAAELARWPGGREEALPERADGNRLALADLSTVLAGDPAQKAVAAWHAGLGPSSDSGLARAWRLPYLMSAMEDRYPAVRRFARQSALAIVRGWPDSVPAGDLASALGDFDFMAGAEQRVPVVDRMRTAWGSLDKRDWPAPPRQARLTTDWLVPPALEDELRQLGRRQDKQIAIGE